MWQARGRRLTRSGPIAVVGREGTDVAQQKKITINPENLVHLGIISAHDLARARDEVQQTPSQGGVVGALLRAGAVTVEDIYRVHASENNLGYVTQEEITPTVEVRNAVPFALAREHEVVPVKFDDSGRLVVAVETLTHELRTTLEQELPYELIYVIASSQTLKDRVRTYYSAGSEAASISISAEMQLDTEAPSLDALLESGSEDAGVSRTVRLLITEGISEGASDIHLEPFGMQYRVRYRIDNELRVFPDLVFEPIEADRVIARIKVLSSLDVTERRLPQDGRITFRLNKQTIDLRVAVVPVHSPTSEQREKVVMRILANDLAGRPLNELDFSETNLRMMREALRRKHGMILVTGPTGSGKSTTLYSSISEVATDQVNVMAAEDPVEYRFAGVNQVQINEKNGITFPNALRSFLRADPDIILIGEIRDEETAQIAIQASLTGHLVLSTLHTNSAALTVSRLLDMHVKPYLLGDALVAALSQRLVRRLCRHCRVPVTASPQEVLALSGAPAAEPVQVFAANPQGCRSCRAGYSGRIAVHELMVVGPEVRRAISEGRNSEEIEAIAIQSGRLTTLAQDGWLKITQGLTDVAQVAALIGEIANESEPSTEARVEVPQQPSMTA